MGTKESLKKEMRRQLTVMLIPHSRLQPVQIHLSVALLIFLAVSWAGLTVWSGYIVSRHVDYWRARTDEQVLRAKVWYLAREMKRSREYLDHVRETEIALESILRMKSRKAIVESDAMGGPTRNDVKQVEALLSGRLDQLNINDISDEFQLTENEEIDIQRQYQDITKYIKDQHDIFRSTPVDWPTHGRLTSLFGMRNHPLEELPEHEFHRGIDIANSEGTPIRVTADGIVRIASWQGGYGRLVVVDHGHGYRTYYAHNARFAVKPGDVVKRGQIISYMGTSGRSTGFHVHYEVWQNGRVVNPLRFVKAQTDTSQGD